MTFQGVVSSAEPGKSIQVESFTWPIIRFSSLLLRPCSCLVCSAAPFPFHGASVGHGRSFV
jgi:hypothetical protein